MAPPRVVEIEESNSWENMPTPDYESLARWLLADLAGIRAAIANLLDTWRQKDVFAGGFLASANSLFISNARESLRQPMPVSRA